ncbi:MAG: hypothetical protein ACTHKG_06240 [Nocardioides sp.]
MSGLRRGLVFTHATHLDMAWKPGPGQRYADAPKVRCVVTRVTGAAVYFQHADAQGRPAGGKACLPRERFEATYGSQFGT